MPWHTLHSQAQRLAQDLLQALPTTQDPWNERVRGWALDWVARSAQSTLYGSVERLKAACEAAAGLRALLSLAPEAPSTPWTTWDQVLEDWLAQAQAYLDAAAMPASNEREPNASSEKVRQALQKAHQHGQRLQPNSAWCFVCGLRNPIGLKVRFLQAAPGRAVAYVVVPEAYQGYPGVVHGGVVAALLDEVTGRAGTGTDPQHSRLFYTARLSIRYRRHVPTQRLLRLEGELVRDRGRFYEARGAIYEHGSPRALAQAEALLAEVPPTELAAMNPDALGWRIYPLEDCAR